MEPITWVLIANVTVWLGLGLYTFFLAAKARAITKQLKKLARLSQ